jgi:hypothetical protein
VDIPVIGTRIDGELPPEKELEGRPLVGRDLIDRA